MSSAREHFALEWIKSDLLDTLDQARVALDEYAELGHDPAQMRVCLTALHQVHGTLLMLELQGVTLLADHLEQLSQSLLDDQIADTEGAGEALMQGILELPGYIDELLRGVPDSVSPTLALVNEIRRHLNLAPQADRAGASLIEGASEAAVEHFLSIDGGGKVARIRRAYQSVLLNILKGEDRTQAVDVLDKIASGLQKVTAGSAHERQWQAFGEYVSSLANKQGALESEAVKLLRRADLELKELVKDGPKALRKPANVEFVQALLRATVERDHNSAIVDGLQQAVARDVENNTLAISGRQAMGSAAGALRDELAVVKDRLDMLVRADEVDLQRLRDIVAPLQRIASTLSLLGFESSRAIVADQVDAIENLVVLGDGDTENVVSIAGALVQVDENLASTVLSGGQSEVEQITNEAQLQVLREARKGLDSVKQNVVDFVTAKFEVGHLQGVDGVLRELSGALEIIPLPRIIAVVEGCARYIESLQSGHQPDWSELDRFADAVSAADYYLERLAEDSPGQLDEILDVAQRSLHALAVQPLEEDVSPDLALAAEESSVLPPLQESNDGAALSDHAAEPDAPEEEVLDAELDEPSQAEPLLLEPEAAAAPELETSTLEQRDTDPDAAIKLAREEDASFDLTGDVFADLEGTVEAPVFGAADVDTPLDDEAALPADTPEADFASSEQASADAAPSVLVSDADETTDVIADGQQNLGEDSSATDAWTLEPLDSDEPPAVAPAALEEFDLDALQTPDWESPSQEQDEVNAASQAPGIEFELSMLDEAADVVEVPDLALDEAADVVEVPDLALDEAADVVETPDLALDEALIQPPENMAIDDAPVVTSTTPDEPAYPLELTTAAEDPQSVEQSGAADTEVQAEAETEAEPELRAAQSAADVEQDSESTPSQSSSIEGLDTLAAAPLPDDEAGSSVYTEVEDLADLMQMPGETPEQESPAAFVAAQDTGQPAEPADAHDDLDAEILEIFAEEVDEVLENIDEWLPTWARSLTDAEALAEVRRGFHTLKGSGRIVQAEAIGDVSWAVENMLNRVIEGTVAPSREFVDVVNRTRGLMPRLRDAFVAAEPPDLGAIAQIVEDADVLASGGALTTESPAADPAPAAATPDNDTAIDFAALAALEEDLLQGAEEPAGSELIQDDSEELFFAEAQEHLDSIAAENAQIPWALTPTMARAWHTLAGSARVAKSESVQLLVEPTYQVVEAYRDQPKDAELEAFLRAAHTHVQETLHALREATPWEEPLEFVASADDLLARGKAVPAMGEQFVQHPATAALFEAEEELHGLLEGRNPSAPGLTQAAGALAELAEDSATEPLRATLKGLGQALVLPKDAGPVAPETATLLRAAYDLVVDQLNEIVAGDELSDGEDLLRELRALARLNPAVEAREALSTAETEVDDDDTIELPDVLPTAQPAESAMASTLEAASPQDVDAAPETSGSEQAAPEQDELESASVGVDDETAADIDPDLVEVFFDEAEELCEQLEASIFSWSREPDNRIYMEDMLRGLHTFKGGARLCGLVALGDMAHNFETLVIEVQNDVVAVDTGLFDELNKRYDELNAQLVSVKAAIGAADLAAPDKSDPKPVDVSDRDIRPVGEISEPEVPTQPGPERPAQEMVRVGSLLLEELVNLAGESSILRARIEQGMSDFTVSLDEMETTIERLREQLRRLEIETETQILFRHENADGPNYENFDPLEMDRYNQLQQLSRSLSESASDMLDLKETLLFKARESETLLLQQARINTELQEGLMRTRMVPFSRLVPRLRRIVRQVASELDKDVEFHVQNAEGELDRNLLERMVPALEHMLRNAVDHGIEDAELRRNFGKPRTGRIDLMLSREGGDVVLEISDDGAGIDVESVRAKAVERGLLAQDAQLSDEEMLQFILAPGFTTAKLVTQISGRGVGMDVVHSEVKQLGGSINIVSRPGRGTRFMLRVPFTVSVNRALMVSVNEDLYAIPLNMIEGIVLLSAEQISDLYNSDTKTFEYAGVPYRVRYLGQYLGREYRGIGLGQTSVPVVLVRSGDHAVAVHVDNVQGSREIVVKSLGPQFAGVGGISGATILGDGSVVVILDLLALIRAQQHHNLRRNLPNMNQTQRSRCVMVVDDSVTVRKVTSRLLERQGMDVLIAKDGVEAVAMLAERRPDVMLLDIEMPRMDGFEVARQVRRDDRLGNLPIVMISSRTGDKHKEHANQLGVNRFLGKPFQENELLATIDELVTR